MSEDITVLEAKRLGATTCSTTFSLGAAARLMVAEDISALVVVDAQGYLAGVISRSDIVRAACAGGPWARHPVSAHMTSRVITVTPETKLRRVAELLQENHIHRVVVVVGEGEQLRPVAVVSAGDVLYHLVHQMDD